MSRALLQQALDALNTCYVVVDNPDDCGFNRLLVAPAIRDLRAALAQPEPLNAWREAVLDQCALSHMPFYKDDPRKTITEVIDWYVQAATDSILSQHEPEPTPIACMWTEHSGIAGSPLIRYADITPGYITDAVLLYAAPPAPDAGISWKESEIKSALIAYALEFPLTSDGDPDVGNIHANIRALKKRADADRLDAQRYRWLRTALYGPAIPVGEAYITLRVSGACPGIDEIDAAIDAAIATGGQP